VVAAALFDGTALDLFSHFQDFLASPEVDICGRQIVQAFVIAPEIVVVDELGAWPCNPTVVASKQAFDSLSFGFHRFRSFYGGFGH